ncbi:unnamed protein product [Ilex paraguariensis]|uniref:Uncharacterized protein n=1 Tax=Ilex paraguariensis TaxID=185542 RepID=A0ABC8UAC6_9AQUA
MAFLVGMAALNQMGDRDLKELGLPMFIGLGTHAEFSMYVYTPASAGGKFYPHTVPRLVLLPLSLYACSFVSDADQGRRFSSPSCPCLNGNHDNYMLHECGSGRSVIPIKAGFVAHFGRRKAGT